jgi:hypothetical protein
MGLPLGLVEYDRRNDRLSSLPDQIVIEPVDLGARAIFVRN